MQILLQVHKSVKHMDGLLHNTEAQQSSFKSNLFTDVELRMCVMVTYRGLTT